MRQAIRQRARAEERSRARIDAALASQRAAMTLRGARPPRGKR
ncbi:hypothetical protein DB32_000549 [Sandaracinus amylolyticus]|uniref:Uncharacterized protein n=1 Tax=Sandaracinus amylolyticus TaxID=927083 RepID=A0A0F6VZ80_9BACT|nr:hypothetical protein DB32_000549 [Sandaracinus amylolyticus]